MKKIMVFVALMALCFCVRVSADALRTIRIERPEYPGYVEEFQEMDVLGSSNLSHDLPDIEIGKVYEYTHHRICLDGVDIGVTYHEKILNGPNAEFPYLIQVRLGPNPAKMLPNVSPERTDVNHDGKVDEADLIVVMVCRANPKDFSGDVDGSKVVDQVDLDLVYKFFGIRISAQALQPKGGSTSTWGRIKEAR